MLRAFCVFTCVAALSSVVAVTSQAARPSQLDESATITGVVRGDTFVVRRAGRPSARVRLIGVDAPARGECFAAQATAAARRLSLGKRVTLQTDSADVLRDREGRLHRYIVLRGGRDVGAELLRQGFARIGAFDEPFRKLAAYRDAEAVGRNLPTSLWTCAKGSGNPTEGLRGLADFHSHEFADVGFGGRVHTHSTDPAAPCRPPLGGADGLAGLVRFVFFLPARVQDGYCFPTPTNLAGQQMDNDSLRRAWQYGLRLLVVHAVNSQFLCREMQLGCPTSDLPAIDAQIDAAYALQNKIDQEAGGPGRGWYRIVRTPKEARQVIGDGKLAVVLGVESANAYGCVLRASDVIDGLLPFSHETTWDNDCSTPAERDPTEYALALMEHYWARGVRHFFLIHNIDGIAGGTALGTPILHAPHNPSRLPLGGVGSITGDVVTALDTIIGSVRPTFVTRPCPQFKFEGGICNAKGLTRTGVALAKLAGDFGALIDVDHMSLLSRAALWRTLGESYPVISSHSGVAEINRGDKKAENQLTAEDVARIVKWGGAFAPILHPVSTTDELEPAALNTPPINNCGGTTETFIPTYRYIVDRLNNGTRFDGSKPYPGVGFGSDFNGLAGWPEGRFMRPPDALTFFDPTGTLYQALTGDTNGGQCYPFNDLQTPRVQYPFKSPLTGESFGRSVLPWSGRPVPYDISYDGVAHVGMIPDFVEEMRVLLGNNAAADKELEPLWHGAEAYIQTWERANAFAGKYNPERERGILEQCRDERQVLLTTSTVVGAEHELFAKWAAASAKLRQLNCLGTEPEPAVCASIRVKLTQTHQALEDLVDKLATLLKTHSGSDDEIEALRERIADAKGAVADAKQAFDDAGCFG